MGDYYITPLVTHVKKREKNGVLMFNHLWFSEITDTQTFFFFNYNRVWLSLCKKMSFQSVSGLNSVNSVINT